MSGVGRTMRVLRDTPLEVGLRWSQLRPPRASLTLAVKGTFALPAPSDDGAACALAAKQQPMHGDVHEDEDPDRSLRFAADLALFKPVGECLVAGSCHPPGDAPVGVSVAAFRVGPLRRALAVFGDRRWNALGLASKPAPFRSMPLVWERALGGPSSAENPAGVGLARGAHAPLPNLEDPAALLTERGASPAPVCFAPLRPTWSARARYAGTYDAAWRRERWPYLPADFDLRYEQAAPLEQRLARGYFVGDEELALQNLVAGRPLVRARLPGLRARVLLGLRGVAAAHEVRMVLDTVTLDADAGEVRCVWRGVYELTGADDELEFAYVTHDELAAPRGPTALHERFARRRDDERRAEEGFAAEEPRGVASRAVLTANELPLEAREARAERLHAALAAGSSLAGQSFAGAWLDGASLAEAKLAGVALRGASLRGADLRAADLSGAVLVDADLRGAKLAGAKLARADLSDAVLDDADLAGCDASDAVLVDASAARAVLRGARLVRADAVGAVLDDADLSAADLTQADLSRGSAARARFVAATLRDLDASGAVLVGACLDRAQVTTLRCSGADLTGATARELHGEGALFVAATLARAVLSFSTLPRANFSGARLAGAHLDGCVLAGARFDRAQGAGLTLRGSDAREASFAGALLDEADLRGASLYRAEFLGASLAGAALELAALEESRLDPRYDPRRR